jgi:hypothetical protein
MEKLFKWMPKTLYKYRTYKETYIKNIDGIDITMERTSQSVNSLLESKIFLPSIDTFNDPYDSSLPFRYKTEDLTKENLFQKGIQLSKTTNPKLSDEQHHWFIWKNTPYGILNNPDEYEKFDQNIYDKNRKSFGVFCLTKDPLNHLMWSYYGDSHKGICIGYDTKKLLEGKLFGMMAKVNYTNKIPQHELLAFQRGEHFYKIFFTKWKIWKHEKEYRLLHEYKTGKLQSIQKEVIKEVVLGANFPEKDKLGFVTDLQEIFPNIEIYEAHLNKETFKVEKKKVFDSSLCI